MPWISVPLAGGTAYGLVQHRGQFARCRALVGHDLRETFGQRAIAPLRVAGEGVALLHQRIERAVVVRHDLARIAAPHRRRTLLQQPADLTQW